MSDEWPPGPRPPAPLDLVQDLLSTWYGHLAGDGDELIPTPAALAAWCREHGAEVADRDVTAWHLDLAHRLREGLRAALAVHNNATVAGDQRVLRELAELGRELRLTVSLGDEPTLVPVEAGVEGCLARVLAAPVLAPRRDWRRLKVCREPQCRTAFFDASRNGSRTWCSMVACGAANKQRAFIERRRARNAT